MAKITDLTPVTKRGQTWWREIVFKAIIKRDGAVCSYCHRDFLTEDLLHCHHVLPVIDGGIDDLDNLVLCHNSCHMKLHAEMRGYSRFLANLGTKVFTAYVKL